MNHGIVTACCKSDYHMVKATCASIRHFMRDVPICVVVDGDFSIEELVTIYNVIPLYTSKLKCSNLRWLCQGSTRSKLAAQWEGPFERYLYLDSDAVAWGNVLSKLDLQDADFHIATDPQSGPIPNHHINFYWFNTELLSQIDPEFDPKDKPLFCDGVYAARRGCLPLERALELQHLVSTRMPALFSWTKCQGLTNYLVFSESIRGNLSYKIIPDFQYLVPDHPKSESEIRFGKDSSTIPDSIPSTETRVIHFCGQKPLLQNRQAYSSPFTAFRKQHITQSKANILPDNLRVSTSLFLEEAQVALTRLRRRIISIR